jgi:hypothetical protein
MENTSKKVIRGPFDNLPHPSVTMATQTKRIASIAPKKCKQLPIELGPPHSQDHQIQIPLQAPSPSIQTPQTPYR